MENTDVFIVVRKHYESGKMFPVINDNGEVSKFKTEIEASVEKNYLQPDYQEVLAVYKTTFNLDKISYE